MILCSDIGTKFISKSTPLSSPYRQIQSEDKNSAIKLGSSESKKNTRFKTTLAWFCLHMFMHKQNAVTINALVFL